MQPKFLNAKILATVAMSVVYIHYTNVRYFSYMRLRYDVV